MASAAKPALRRCGSSVLMTGLISKSSSITYSADVIDEVTPRLHSMMGARGIFASISLDRPGGWRDVGRGGAEQ